MKMSARHRRQLEVAGWLMMAAVWALYAGLVWRDLYAGQLTRAEFLRDIARLGFVTLLVLAPRITGAWKARQPKPPPVYRSTILD